MALVGGLGGKYGSGRGVKADGCEGRAAAAEALARSLACAEPLELARLSSLELA